MDSGKALGSRSRRPHRGSPWPAPRLRANSILPGTSSSCPVVFKDPQQRKPQASGPPCGRQPRAPAWLLPASSGPPTGPQGRRRHSYTPGPTREAPAWYRPIPRGYFLHESEDTGGGLFERTKGVTGPLGWGGPRTSGSGHKRSTSVHLWQRLRCILDTARPAMGKGNPKCGPRCLDGFAAHTGKYPFGHCPFIITVKLQGAQMGLTAVDVSPARTSNTLRRERGVWSCSDLPGQ